MTEYLSPGVYIEEFEIGAKPMEGVSTSTAGFLGETERGPTTPCLITSWLQYQRVFGGYFGNNKYLPGSVEGFFKNGGQRCYIARIVKSGSKHATTAYLELKTENTDALTVEAVGEGNWGNRIAIQLSKGTFSGFRLDVFYWKAKFPKEEDLKPEKLKETLKNCPPTISEIFDNVSVKEESPDYFEKTVNRISNLIKLSIKDGDSLELPDSLQDSTGIQYLGIGSDGEGDLVISDYERCDPEDNVPGKRKGLTALKEIDDISLIYAPNASAISGLDVSLISHCENLRYRFAILDAPQGSSNVSDLNPRNENSTDFAAFYYPWIKVINPETGMLQFMPPGGYVAGIYARSDAERGVHKAPANEIVFGATGLEFQIIKGEQDVLNPRGVNVIRAFPGRGIRIWGARTLSSNTLWKYINVRRLFIYIEASIERGTQWVVFEPNDERLWARVKATITQFLTGIWRSGALVGKTPEEAFFVKCDRSTMTQDDIDNGRLICLVGIAPVKPAEFVVFRIAQWQGGSEATE